MDAIQMSCPHCNATNKLPRERLDQQPKCGKCHKQLFTGKPVALNSVNFAKYIAADIPVVVEFWAPWCGYCQKMMPAFARATGELEPAVRTGTVNTDVEKGLGARYSVEGLPTMILFRKGREVARQSGAMPIESIIRWVRSH